MRRLLGYLDSLEHVLALVRFGCGTDIHEAARRLRVARETHARIFVCGNGGSAATASHFACDLLKTAGDFRVVALTDNSATLTAYANDLGYEAVFAQQLRALSQPGDLLVAISASGDSHNILTALLYASAHGLQAVGLLGFDGGEAKGLCDTAVVVPSNNYGQVEDVHLAICHSITAYFREA
jgi:D-sedoheptulose 7-phosphate isomerase